MQSIEQPRNKNPFDDIPISGKGCEIAYLSLGRNF
jgi:hypothetical protein